MDFTQPWDFGDGIFILEDKTIYINKATLVMSSDVFRAMFTSDFKERKMTEILLPDKKFDDFVVLMHAVHPPHTALADNKMENNVERLLPLAQEYLLHHVVGRCEKYLLTQPHSIHNLILADKFSLPELRQVCIKYVKDIALQELDQDPDFKLVGSESLAEIYRSKLDSGEDRESFNQMFCNLMSQPPSINNLLLAEKYAVPPAYEKCLKYVKDTPLSQLKAEAGFTELKPDTVIEVLRCKVEKLENFKDEVAKLADWGKVGQDLQEFCTSTYYSRHVKTSITHCAECTKYKCLICTFIMDFTRPWDSGDVTFVVEGKKIYANKAVLMIFSNVFKVMFTADFAEKDMDEIPLQDKKFGDFLELMHVVHPQSFKRLDDCNVHRVLPLAHEYQMHGVFNNCCTALSDGAPSIRSLNMAEKYNLKLPQLDKKGLQYLKDTPLKQLTTEPGFTELKLETLVEALKFKVEKVEKPIEILKAELFQVTDWERCLGGYNEHPGWCPASQCTELNGTDKYCPECVNFRFEYIRNVLKRFW